jgi:hypothetical protein
MSLLYVQKFQIGGTGLHDIQGRNKKTGMPLNSNFAVYTQGGNDYYSNLGDNNYNTNFMYTHRIKNPNVTSLDGNRTYGDVGLALDSNNKLYGRLGLEVTENPRKKYDMGLGIGASFNNDGLKLTHQGHLGSKFDIGKYGSNLKGTYGYYLSLAGLLKKEQEAKGEATMGTYGRLSYQPKKSPFSFNLYGNAGIANSSYKDKPYFTWNAGLSATANLNAIRKKVKPQHKVKPQPQGGNWVNQRYNS